MTGPEYVRGFVLPAAFALLPGEMASAQATAMLLATGYQESRFEARRQINGPARGYWQFEQGGAVLGVLRHEATAGVLSVIWRRLGYTGAPTPYGLWTAIEHHDVLAAVCARLLLWTLPDQMPARTQVDAGWFCYVSAWRPGKARPDTWSEAWAIGWAA